MKFIYAILITVLLLSCDGSSSSDDELLTAKGSRLLGMDIKDVPALSWADGYLKAYNDLHVDSVKFSLDWNTTETTVGDYTALEGLLDNIGLVFQNVYGSHEIDITLVLRPVDTASINVPSGGSYDGNPFDDSLQTAAALTDFKNYISHIYSYLGSNYPVALAKVKIIQIGNEYGGQIYSPVERSNWLDFLQGTVSHIHSTFGNGVKTGSVADFKGLTSDHKDFFKAVNAVTDIVSVNYYAITDQFNVKSPMNKAAVASDFASVLNIYPGRMIVFQECGVPSSPDCSSNESIQSDFLDAVFAAWDDYRESIIMIDFAWQTDVGSSQVDSWVTSYGMSGSPYETQFAGYLGSLGYINYDGTEKSSWGHFKGIIGSRGW